MNSIPDAFSLELKQMLSLSEAIRHVSAGDLKNRHAFRCPGSNCQTKATLVCIATNGAVWKQKTHFRTYGEHSENCEYVANLRKRLTETTSASTKTPSGEIRRRPDELRFAESSEESSPPPQAVADRRIDLGNSKFSGYVERIDNGRLYSSLQPVVARFLSARNQGLEAELEIKYEDQTLTYDEFFREINRQHVEPSDTAPRVWWGHARVARSKNDHGYIIHFERNLGVSEGVKTPTCYLSDPWLQRFGQESNLAKTLLRARETSRRATAYILTTPEINELPEHLYINLNPKHPKHVYVRFFKT